MNLPLGEMLFVTATGAWRPAAAAVREQQVLALTDLEARHRYQLPSIIAGDLNASPDAASVRFLTGKQALNDRGVLFHDAWSIAGDGPGYTWAVENPNAKHGADQIIGQDAYRARFDYVLVGGWEAHPKGPAKVAAAELAFDKPVAGVWASDHFGVVVDLDLSAS